MAYKNFVSIVRDFLTEEEGRQSIVNITHLNCVDCEYHTNTLKDRSIIFYGWET